MAEKMVPKISMGKEVVGRLEDGRRGILGSVPSKHS